MNHIAGLWRLAAGYLFGTFDDFVKTVFDPFTVWIIPFTVWIIPFLVCKPRFGLLSKNGTQSRLHTNRFGHCVLFRIREGHRT